MSFSMLRILSCLLFSATLVACDDYPISSQLFPEGFSFGAATAAFQIEGAWNESGKGEQIWDWWMHNYPEKIETGATGDVACDSYHKWREDVELLKNLGANHYRLSISWSRIFPNGLANNFTLNQEGVTYYRNLIEALLEANITPYVTLYHWDLPLPLHELGGWLNKAIADHFAEYARVCFREFGDLVKNWMTINEPHTYCYLGYGTGEHAPGFQHAGEGFYKCAYVSLLAHAKAYHIYNDEFRASQGGRVSIVIDSPWLEPVSETTENIEAVSRLREFFLGVFAHPVYIGNWPEQMIQIVDERSKLEGFSTSRLPKFTDEEVALIKGTSDFYSLNTYATYLVEHQNNYDEMIDPNNVTFLSDQGAIFSGDPSWASDVNWVYRVPAGFRKLLNYVYNTYGQPEIIITENGWAQNITTASLADQDRITYIEQYLSALLDAIYEDNVNVTGYTVWSILDNLEWAHGYQQKLGLVRVDFDDPERTRTPKDSYYWLQNVIKNRRLTDEN